MKLYPDAVEDTRTRAFLPAVRIPASEKCTGGESLLHNRNTQVFLWNPGTRSVSIAPGGWILLDFGKEVCGGVHLLCASAGKIRVRFGESASEAMNTPNQDHGIHDAELIVPKWSGFEYGSTAFRFVRIDSLETEKELVFQNILAAVLYQDLEWVGAFESSEERLNQIWKTSVYTVQLCMQNLIWDGCKRDRLPWVGDLNAEQRTILAVFSDTSLLRKTLDYCKAQNPPGCWMNNIASYSIWFVICHWEYYFHTGDLAYLAEQKEIILRILKESAAVIGKDGSEHVTGFRFLEWSGIENPQALHGGLLGLFYWGFRAGGNILRALGEDDSFCVEIAQRMKQCIPDCGGNKAAYAVQTVGGLADRTSFLLENPLKGMTAFFGCYILNALPTETALEVIRRYWGGMLDYGATTFWEEFDLDWLENTSPISELPVPGKKDLHADFGTHCYQGYRRSLCHGWASGPASFLSWRIPGIRFLEAGGRYISLHPDPCGPEYVKGALATAHGPIRYELENHKLKTLELPEGISLKETGE